ncbi:MAG: ABC transporter substrate-binding protein [Hyphomicrobiaceae bacterium]
MLIVRPFATALGLVTAAALGLAPAAAQQKELKIGLIFDQTGAYAGGGSIAASLGSKYAIEIMNERGGVEGLQDRAGFCRCAIKADVAVNEARRLISEQKVDMLMGSRRRRTVYCPRKWMPPRSSGGRRCVFRRPSFATRT